MVTLSALRSIQQPLYQPFYRFTVFDEQRATLVEELRTKGIRDERILRVLGEIKREEYVHPAFIKGAYADSALPIACRQTISQPYTVALMTSLLQIQPGSKILEVGTGSGYQAMVLYKLGAQVFTIERFPELAQGAETIFKREKANIALRVGDGSTGWEEVAPFNGIIVTAGAPEVPPLLLEQLSVGGHLVIPVGDKRSQTLCRYTRMENGEYHVQKFSHFRFVPLVGLFGWDE